MTQCLKWFFVCLFMLKFYIEGLTGVDMFVNASRFVQS